MARLNGRRPAPGAIAQALRPSRRTIITAAAVSAAINCLALTGSIYALKILNVVVPGRDGTALILLTLAMLALYAASGLLDALRADLLSRTALQLDCELTARVFAAQHDLSLQAHGGAGVPAMHDLDRLRAFLASAAPTALFDMPFLPLYLGVIFLLHPLLGALAVAGALLLIALMLRLEKRSDASARAAASASDRATFAADAQRSAEAMRAMGFLAPATARWRTLNAAHRDAERKMARQASNAAAAIKAARPALQSTMLGLGAYLAINGSTSAGSMLAASIILARGLAPLETLIAHWRSVLAARASCTRLAALLAATSPPVGRALCDRPARELCVEALSLAPPGAQGLTLHEVSFTLAAGAGLAILGPSGAGKSTLARALVGAWPARSGAVRLDGVSLCGFEPESLGHRIGYLPQDAYLFSGTIADNISRFGPAAGEAAVAAAARAAGAERLIQSLPSGCLTQIGLGGLTLSKGQRQRIALARALYNEPFLLVLDEPDANLDGEGVRDLNAAIGAARARGGIVIVMTHQGGALASLDQVLVLAGGRVAARGRFEPPTPAVRKASAEAAAADAAVA